VATGNLVYTIQCFDCSLFTGCWKILFLHFRVSIFSFWVVVYCLGQNYFLLGCVIVL
jgi:hypothetical protein